MLNLGDFENYFNSSIIICILLIQVKSVTELNALVNSLQKELSTASKGTPTASPDSTRRMVAIDNLVSSCILSTNLNFPPQKMKSLHPQEHKCATKDLLIRTLSEIVVKADDFGSATAVVRRLRETTFKPSYVVNRKIDFNLDSLCKFIEESNARRSSANGAPMTEPANIEAVSSLGKNIYCIKTKIYYDVSISFIR